MHNTFKLHTSKTLGIKRNAVILLCVISNAINASVGMQEWQENA